MIVGEVTRVELSCHSPYSKKLEGKEKGEGEGGRRRGEGEGGRRRGKEKGEGEGGRRRGKEKGEGNILVTLNLDGVGSGLCKESLQFLVQPLSCG